MNKHHNTIATALYGLVLAGGQSTRMGADKSLIAYHGKPQHLHVFELLSQYCDQVYTSCKHPAEKNSFKNPLADVYALHSPLNGILTAFAHAPKAAWLTLPVDMPNVDAHTLAYLLQHRDTSRVATCFYDSDVKYPEPLLAVWEPAAKQLLENFYSAGNSSPRKFLIEHHAHVIKAVDVKVLTNINTSDDLKLYDERIKSIK